MAQKHINYGTPNGKNGEFVREAFVKTEGNFTELYGRVDDLDQITNNIIDGIADGKGTYTWLKYSLFPNGLDGTTPSMSDEPLEGGILYRGLALNQESRIESDDPTLYEWVNASVTTIDNGDGTWTWIAYANTANPFSGVDTNPLGKKWLGFANPMDTDGTVDGGLDPRWLVPAHYDWTRVIANDGKDGVPIEGTTKYAWFKYSPYFNGKDPEDSSISIMVDDPTPLTGYVGIAYNKDTYIESLDAVLYEWSSLKGDIQQDNGLWTWLKYADSPTDEVLSDIALGKSYIGFAFDKETAESLDSDSELYENYQWSKLYSEEGGQNNVVREVLLNLEDLDNGEFTSESIANWVNKEGLTVTEIENIVFSTTEETVVVAPILNNNDINLTLVSRTSDSLSMAWSIPLGDPNVTAWKLSYRLKIDATFTVVDIYSPTTFNAVIPGLTSASVYEIKIVASDTAGNQKSDLFEVNTLTDAPPSTPYINNSSSSSDITADSISLTWDIDDFPVASWELRGGSTYYAPGGELSYGSILPEGSTINNYSHIGLLSETTYYYVVRAKTSAGAYSNWSVPKDFTTLRATISSLGIPTVDITGLYRSDPRNPLNEIRTAIVTKNSADSALEVGGFLVYSNVSSTRLQTSIERDVYVFYASDDLGSLILDISARVTDDIYIAVKAVSPDRTITSIISPEYILLSSANVRIYPFVFSKSISGITGNIDSTIYTFPLNTVTIAYTLEMTNVSGVNSLVSCKFDSGEIIQAGASIPLEITYTLVGGKLVASAPNTLFEILGLDIGWQCRLIATTVQAPNPSGDIYSPSEILLMIQ